MGVITIFIVNTNKKNWKKTLLILMMLAIIIIVLCNIILNIEIKYNATLEWVKTAIEEIIMFIKGKNVGYFDVLFNEFIIIPEGIQIIYGTGEYILGKKTDVGFISDLNMGGIILYVLLYPAYIYMICNIKSENKEMERTIRTLGILTFLVMNIKWSATQPNNMISLYIMLYMLGKIQEKNN